MDLTDKQWDIVKEFLQDPPRRPDGRGRPRRSAREILNGVLWILRTGAQWQDLPRRYPPYQTCHRRYQEWVQKGAFEQVLIALAKDLEQRGGLDLEEAFIDGSFSGAKKGDPPSGKRSVARAQKSWQLQTAMVFLSPYPLTVLRRMKQNSSTKP
jgi:transposase